MHDWHTPAEDRIRARTSERSNRRIDRATLGAIDAALGSPDRVRARLAEIDREWSVDRALMLNFAVLNAVAAVLTIRSLKRTRKVGGWGALLFTQLGFLGYHALRSWCPPLPVFRWLGFRSDREICAERAALQRRLG